ncbi:uncharacterized protein UTRI_03311 [Ustilago trichophora]|uniref:Uncharacterized protein n=1 Tax=Ustilago trichophora TaxID=86804 RepID=A0A5C3E8N1_9BASI|nr:uncharacterized protein UTRI_03311 [Ustilago trichophora]
MHSPGAPELPVILPHQQMDYILDAKYLWHTVTNMKMLPGMGHTLDDARGVTERWKDFLRNNGKRVLDDSLDELVFHIKNQRGNKYRGVEPRFERFISDPNMQVLPVPGEGDQFMARSFVNAFTSHWYQQYYAEREAQLEALRQEEAARQQGWRGPARSRGSGDVSFSGPHRSSSGSNSENEEDTGRSW